MANILNDNHASSPLQQRRWRIAWLLGLGVLVNYFDRVNLSTSHAALISAFGMSDITFGYLSSAYNWTYALCQLPIGVLLDKFGVRRVGRISTFVWSIASFAAAVTPNVGGFFAARLLLGVGEAPTFPANAKAIGQWFPPNERSFATAIFDSAAKFASAIGVPLLGLALLEIGWRWSFAVTGVISLFYFLLFFKVYDSPPSAIAPDRSAPETAAEVDHAKAQFQDDERLSIETEHTGKAASLSDLLRQRKVLGLALGFGAYNYVFYLLLTWLPSYLSSALHVDLLHSFLYTGVPWLFATMTDLFLGGMLTDWLIQHGHNASRVRQIVLIGGTAFGLAILGAAYTHSAPLALLWISVSIGGLAAAAPVGWSIPSLIAPREDVGKVGGIVNFSNQISGILAPIVTGYIVYGLHSYAWAFRVSAIYLVIGIAGYILLLGKIEPMPPLQKASPLPTE